MTKFRVVRQFGSNIRPTENKAYRVESVELMTENEAFKLLEELGSPYADRKYEETKPVPTGAEVKTRSGVFPSEPYVKQENGTWRPKYD